MFPADGKSNQRHKDKMEPASHKIIEKRRRDRINNCLAELSQTVPAAFAKQNSGKLEKAEILEMTVEYLRAIQATELGLRLENGEWFSPDVWGDFMRHYQTGYSDCIREIVRFMTEVEGLDLNDCRCLRLLAYLQTRFKPDASVSAGMAYKHVPSRMTAGLGSVTTNPMGSMTPSVSLSQSRDMIGLCLAQPAAVSPFGNNLQSSSAGHNSGVASNAVELSSINAKLRLLCSASQAQGRGLLKSHLSSGNLPDTPGWFVSEYGRLPSHLSTGLIKNSK